jgi:hypothetical protein
MIGMEIIRYLGELEFMTRKKDLEDEDLRRKKEARRVLRRKTPRHQVEGRGRIGI